MTPNLLLYLWGGRLFLLHFPLATGLFCIRYLGAKCPPLPARQKAFASFTHF